MQDRTCGRVKLPLASVVTPKTLPLPLDLNVTRLPLTLAVAFQAEENCCGEVKASTTVQLVAPLTVTSVLNRSAHHVPSRNVVVQVPLGGDDGEALGDGEGDCEDGGDGLSVGPVLSALRVVL